MNRAARATAGALALVAALVALRGAATGALAAPPLGSLDALGTWVDEQGPARTALALVRLGAEVTAWYLLVVLLLHILAAAGRLSRAARLADALATPGVRRVVHGALGVGLAVAAAPSGDPAGVSSAVPAVERPTPTPASTARMQPLGSSAAAMRPLGEEVTGTARMAPADPPTTWRVAPGESFWSVAAEVLEDSWQRPPSDAEIDPFWRALVDRNRSRLVAPDDPDLVLPGQVLDVPPVPGPG